MSIDPDRCLDPEWLERHMPEDERLRRQQAAAEREERLGKIEKITGATRAEIEANPTRFEIMAMFGLSEADVKAASEHGGDNDCCNCGNRWWNRQAGCGHWFCDVCLGRGRDEDCGACSNAEARP